MDGGGGRSRSTWFRVIVCCLLIKTLERVIFRLKSFRAIALFLYLRIFTQAVYISYLWSEINDPPTHKYKHINFSKSISTAINVLLVCKI